MGKTEKKVNVFVIGDLVLDHLIPVYVPHGQHPNIDAPDISGQADYSIIRYGLPRQNFAGGAALAARLASKIADRGRVCLWGLSGRSQWGSFHNILEVSQQFDYSENPIHNYAAHSEARRLNTSVIIIQANNPPTAGQFGRRELHIFDLSAHQVTESEARSAFDHVRNERDKLIDVMLFSDLNLNAISADIVSAVGNFSYAQGIPLIVDSRSAWSRYLHIRITCAVLSLDQWSRNVGVDLRADAAWANWLPTDRDSEQEVQRKLKRIGLLSHRRMPFVGNFVINCHNWKNRESVAVIVVVVEPDSTSADDESYKEFLQQNERWDDLKEARVTEIKARKISIFRLVFPGSPEVVEQLGAMRVLSAAVAVEFGRMPRSAYHEPAPVVQAVRRAGRILDRYLDPKIAKWHRIPDFPPSIFDCLDQDSPREILSTSSVDGGELLLPSGRDLTNLREMAIEGTTIVSNDLTYKRKVDDLVQIMTNLSSWSPSPGASSAHCCILTGKGGGGKTEIVNLVRRRATENGIHVWYNKSDQDPLPCSNCEDANSFRKLVDNRLEKIKTDREREGAIPKPVKGLLIIIDEAFKVENAGNFLRRMSGVAFLNHLEELSSNPGNIPVRVLLVDADFTSLLDAGEVDQSQFKSRCDTFELPAITSRLGDIPYIFAMSCLSSIYGNELDSKHRLFIEEDCLVRVINWALARDQTDKRALESQAERGGRLLVRRAREIGARLRQSLGGTGNSAMVRVSDLTWDEMRAAEGLSGDVTHPLQFAWLK